MSHPFRLNKRLRFLLEEIPQASEIWDIGCDHGLLGLTAIAENRATRAHLIDPAHQVIDRLRAFLGSPKICDWWAMNQSRVEILAVPGEEIVHEIKGSIVLAGMGGETMVKIVERVREFNVLVLNPFSHFEEIEDLLKNRDWIVQESTVCDRAISYRVYTINQKPMFDKP